MHKLSLRFFVFVLSFLIIAITLLPTNSYSKEPTNDVQSLTQEAQLAAQQAKILSNIAEMNNNLSDIVECYWTIAQDLQIDDIPGLQEAYDFAIDVLEFVEHIFDGIQDFIDGFELKIGKWTFAVGKIPFFAELTDNLKEIIIKWSTVACEVQLAVSHSAEREVDFPNAEYGCWRENRMPYVLSRVWVNVTGLATLVKSTAKDVCKQDIIVVAGGNLSLICGPISATWGFIKLVAENVKSCDDNIQGSEIAASYLRLAALHHEHLYSDSVFNDYMAFDLRTKIEINLAGHGSHPHAIASFQLPLLYGGHLELAREIVRETIISMNSAGQDVGNAELFFVKANNAFSSGNFKEAYAGFGHSYRAATKPKGLGNDNDH